MSNASAIHPPMLPSLFNARAPNNTQPGHLPHKATQSPKGAAESAGGARGSRSARFCQANFYHVISEHTPRPQAVLQGARASLHSTALQLKAQATRAAQSPAWAEAGHLGLLTTAAVAISIAVGLACAATTTPWLLRLTLPANNVVNMFSQVPLIGSILTGIVQRGGPFGAVASSLVLWFGTHAMFSRGTSKERLVDWSLSAAAVGLALSPVFVPGVPVAGALAAACLLGTAVLAYLTSRAHLPQGSGDWRVNMLAVAVGVAFAPMGAQAAMAVAPVAIIGEALTITTLCTLGIAVHGLIGVLAPLFRENVEAAKLATTHRAPKAFGIQDVPDLQEFIDDIKLGIDRGVPRPTRVALLRGPAGSGKWTMAQALICGLNIPIEMPTKENLQSSGNSALALRSFFEKCKERARLTKQPVAILVKNLHHLWAKRGQHSAHSAENDQMVNAALLYLEQLDGATPSNLIIMGTIDDIHHLDGAISSRVTDFFTVPKPSAATLADIVQARLQTELRTFDFVERFYDANPSALNFPADVMAHIGRQAFDSGCNGRQMQMYAHRLAVRLRRIVVHHDVNLASLPLGDALTHAHEMLWPNYMQERIEREAETEAS